MYVYTGDLNICMQFYMRFVLILFVVAVRYGTVRYRGLPPLDIREYHTVFYYGTVGSCTESCTAALARVFFVRSSCKAPYSFYLYARVSLDLLVSTVPWSGRTVRYGTVLHFLINGLELHFVITVPWDPGVPL